MGLASQKIIDGVWTIVLEGRIDSTSAPEVEAQLKPDDTVQQVVVDAEGLEYTSSAGLRVLLRLRKRYPKLEIINVSSEVYEILEMTGFTEMMTVRKAYATMSVEGCPEIGRGSNGIVYRTDPETIVKVYFNKDALGDIQHERDVARKALILGIPTAISYEVVKVGDGYGSVFELLNADSLSKKILRESDNLGPSVDIYIGMLKLIHGIEAAKGAFPSAKDTAIHWAEFLQEYLPQETYDKLMGLLQAVPEDNHLIHGDYHTNNLMIQDGETLLIDMDTLSQGHPIFEFGTMFLAYVGFHELDSSHCADFLRYPWDVALRFWRASLGAYLGTDDENAFRDLEERASIVGYTRLMRRTIRRIGFDDPAGAAQIEHCKKRLIELCEKYDSLI